LTMFKSDKIGKKYDDLKGNEVLLFFGCGIFREFRKIKLNFTIFSGTLIG